MFQPKAETKKKISLKWRFLIKHFNDFLLEAGNWCFQLVLKWGLKQINQFFSSGPDLKNSALRFLFWAMVFYKGGCGWGCAWSCQFWFLWWIRKEIVTVLSQGFCNCKNKKKERFQNSRVRELPHVGLRAVTRRGCIHWVCFCSATLPS